MQEGRIVEQGRAFGVFDDPQSGYTRTLLEAIPGRGLAVGGQSQEYR
jgi:peptide/nickel transport system ATP-binding protein